jgi:hypothetical protein
MYRQTVTIDELDDHGAARGTYRERRDIIFSPQHERSEEAIGRAENRLKFLSPPSANRSMAGTGSRCTPMPTTRYSSAPGANASACGSRTPITGASARSRRLRRGRIEKFPGVGIPPWRIG